MKVKAILVAGGHGSRLHPFFENYSRKRYYRYTIDLLLIMRWAQLDVQE